MALVQHHDGVSGTAKQAVTNDYVKRIANGVKMGEVTAKKIYLLYVIAEKYKRERSGFFGMIFENLGGESEKLWVKNRLPDINVLILTGILTFSLSTFSASY